MPKVVPYVLLLCFVWAIPLNAELKLEGRWRGPSDTGLSLLMKGDNDDGRYVVTLRVKHQDQDIPQTCSVSGRYEKSLYGLRVRETAESGGYDCVRTLRNGFYGSKDYDARQRRGAVLEFEEIDANTCLIGAVEFKRVKDE